MLQFYRRFREAWRQAPVQKRIWSIADQGREAVESIPQLRALKIMGEANDVVGGVAEMDGFDEELLLREQKGGGWAVRTPGGDIFEAESLAVALRDALASLGSQVWVGSLTNEDFQPEPYDTVAEAEERLEQIRLLDPEGVKNGQYYIDSPEHKVLSGD